MWDARPEELKTEWTGRAVAVRAAAAVGSLARFRGRTGRVRTVNMNGRALVQFDGADETWFDLDPAALEPVTETPETPPPVRAAVGEEPKGAPAPGALDNPPAKMRPETPAQAKAEGGKKLSVLELARQQDAARKASPPPTAAAEPPTAKPAQPEAGKKKLSVLELARQQGAAGQKDQ
ncbi:hypothetical protein [Alienimonas californiensis]|uniref:Uncharacterized protein n=1 Tax=Alienimonas californiensis TaxID=2527989 RepID=A0A517PD36_9PLAN|nr:hypothetical protein [Alienimonas californiensis]QDT17298.1 hypothetical protein CA12_34180 [Alienimonas californiensis]